MKNPRAYQVYLFLEGLSAFCLSTIFTLATVYRLQRVGLDPLQLVLVGTVLEASAFVFEIPTGVVADTFSRRLSVIIGVLVLGGAEMLEGTIPTFAVVLLAQVIAGLGYTFLSGATEAWIADEVGEEHLGPVFLRAQQVGMAGGLAGILACTGLASISLNLPFLVGGGLLVVTGIALIAVMPETGFHPTPRGERSTWQSMAGTFRAGLATVRARPVLLTFLLTSAFFGLTSEGFDRLWQAHFLRDVGFPTWAGLTPVIWLGLIQIVGSLLNIGATEIVRRRVNTTIPAMVTRALVGFNALRIAGLVVFGLAGGAAWALPMALLGYWGAGIFASMQGPLYSTWLTQSIDSRVRATVLSLHSQVNAIGQIVGGPAIGAVGNASLRAALTLTGLLLAQVLPLFRRAQRNDAEHKASGEFPVVSGE